MSYEKIVALPANVAAYQIGQWFKRPCGTHTQYVGLRKLADGRTIPHFCDAGKGESFDERTQRYARARWHLSYKHGDVVTMVRRAPASVDDAAIGKLARAKVA